MPSSYSIHISRHDSEWPGWQVKAWLGSEYAHTKYFSDIKHGGKRKSRKLAEAYREKTQARMPAKLKRDLKRKEKHGSVHAKAKGIYLIDNGKESGSYYRVWEAAWQDENGIRRSRSFSVAKYGFRNARRMAIEAREHAIRKKLVV